jgi:hypothetical protein
MQFMGNIKYVDVLFMKYELFEIFVRSVTNLSSPYWNRARQWSADHERITNTIPLTEICIIICKFLYTDADDVKHNHATRTAKYQQRVSTDLCRSRSFLHIIVFLVIVFRENVEIYLELLLFFVWYENDLNQRAWYSIAETNSWYASPSE